MPTCTRASLIDGASCFKNFSSAQRMSLAIYFAALELAAIGGTNYNSALGSGGQLDLDSVCFMALENPAQVPSLPYLVIAYNNAVAAGASPATTNATLSTAIQCNQNFTMDHKAAQLLWLTCQLGVHKAYPQ